MTIDPREASAALHDIASVERRTREALFYSGSGPIFIMWGLLVACGYAVTELQPSSARLIWLGVSLAGCAATGLIVGLRARVRACETRDHRMIWAVLALAAYGTAWSWLLGPVVPRPMMYAFQPSLFLLGMVLAGLWLGRFFIGVGLVGIALIVIGYFEPEPWLRLWMAMVQSATLILAGVWLHLNGLWR